MTLYEGLSRCLAELPPASVQARLASLMGPLFTQLSTLVTASQTAGNVSNSPQVQAALEHMAVLLSHTRSVPQPHPIVEFVEQVCR